MLTNNVRVYLPSTDGGLPACQDKLDWATGAAAEVLSRLFGGVTMLPGVGCWKGHNGIVREPVTVCESFCDERQLWLGLVEFLTFAQQVGDYQQQECVAVAINGSMYFIDSNSDCPTVAKQIADRVWAVKGPALAESLEELAA